MIGAGTRIMTGALCGCFLLCEGGGGGDGGNGDDAVNVTLPTIGGSPWPGGSIGLTFGEWAPAESVASEIRVDGVALDLDEVPVGAWDASATVLPEHVGGYAEAVEIGEPGAVEAYSDSIEIVPLQGVTRGATGQDLPIALTGDTNLPSSGAILLEVEATTGGTLAAWCLRGGTINGRRSIEIETRWIGAVAEVSTVLRSGSSTARTAWLAAPGITTGTRWLVQARWSNTDLWIDAALPGGTVSTATGGGGALTVHTVAGVTLLPSMALFGTPTAMAYASQAAGTAEAAWFTAPVDLQDVADDGSIRAWGGVGGGTTVGYCYPGSTLSDGDEITDGGALEGATWTLQAGTARLVAGGLNVPLEAP